MPVFPEKTWLAYGVAAATTLGACSLFAALGYTRDPDPKLSLQRPPPEAPPAAGDAAAPTESPEPLDVSMVQLLANPERYDGRVVRILGFVRIEFEGNAIYLHKEDFDHGIAKNGFWLAGPRPQGVSDTYAVLEGTFRADRAGHLGAFSGSIDKITRLDRWAWKRLSDGGLTTE